MCMYAHAHILIFKQEISKVDQRRRRRERKRREREKKGEKEKKTA